MIAEETIQAYLARALATATQPAAFAAACNTLPGFATTVLNQLQAQGLECTFYPHAGKPFAAVHINLVEAKWQETFWWGHASLEINISKLAPVFTTRKVMMQLDYTIEEAYVSSWQHLAAGQEALAMAQLDILATSAGYSHLQGEVSREVDTGTVPLSQHFRQWKPALYDVFFENLTGSSTVQ